MRIRVYGSAQALYCVANALYWKSFKRQIFTHLTVLKHQNTKTSLYELSKNHWVFALFEIFGPVRKRLLSTVFNDHPVSTISHITSNLNKVGKFVRGFKSEQDNPNATCSNRNAKLFRQCKDIPCNSFYHGGGETSFPNVQ